MKYILVALMLLCASVNYVSKAMVYPEASMSQTEENIRKERREYLSSCAHIAFLLVVSKKDYLEKEAALLNLLPEDCKKIVLDTINDLHNFNQRQAAAQKNVNDPADQTQQVHVDSVPNK